MSRKQKPEREEGKVYGFVLVLCGLARAAIMLDKHPAALRDGLRDGVSEGG